MTPKVRIFLSISVAVVLASCGGSDPEPTPVSEAPPTPTVVIPPSPEPTVPMPAPTPALTDILNEVADAFDFVREGVYRGGDGVGGAAWFDYDNDGDLDLYVANTKTEPNALFRNDGGTFSDVAEEAGVTNGEGNSGVAAADINNDGCADLFLSGEGGAIGSRWSPHKLYVNNCDGTFADVSEGSGIVVPEGVWSAAFGDINGDGLLDLFVGGVSALFGGVFRPGPNEIYLNNGDGTFDPVSVTAGLTTQSNTCGVAISDYNGDGLQDLFTANCGASESPELWRSNGDMTFTEVAGEAGIGKERGVSGSANDHATTRMLFADIDLDLDLDILALSYGDVVPGQVPDWIRHQLWENNGDGTYGNVAGQAGITGVGFGWGASFDDFNNDGYPDFYYVGGIPVPPYDFLGVNPGTLYLNRQDGTFAMEEDHRLSGLFASGIATADYDHDGYLDIVVVTAKSQGVGGVPILLRNRGGDNSWITVRLAGTESNRDGVGARVTVTAGDLSYLKETRSGFAFLSTGSPWPTFGLGGHDGPVDVEVEWPSGLTEVFEGQPIRQMVTLTEGTGASR
ncbi:MAG: CRTAC1 family protein [Chloroflexi bacterium]|nr:CRTAC1 family protein [Chloroflexota bacterium]